MPEWFSLPNMVVAGIVLAAAGHLAWRARKYVLPGSGSETGCASGCGSCPQNATAKPSLLQLGRERSAS